MECTVKFPFSNGDKVKDIVTGLMGTVTSISENLDGTQTFWIEPTVTDSKENAQGKWVNGKRIVLVDA